VCEVKNAAKRKPRWAVVKKRMANADVVDKSCCGGKDECRRPAGVFALGGIFAAAHLKKQWWWDDVIMVGL
jgi:hypothetical protein